uniref:Uncharacterized protein n=1 Tax=Vannella robusta TaxID=1487602 RepID=A0A7S4HLW0_9EUKA|mmetsp:Transcript_12633/g.15747  ORF Transcript_12633/g.15747 Transcript_12633/m.15747 type:complete len:251 (+) Transcript_12633:1-753(+)
MDKVKPGSYSGSPPEIFRGPQKTFRRLNLVTGTIWTFANRLKWVLVPLAFTSVLLIDRQKWFSAIFDRQTWHNRQVAKVKYSQEESMEEQSLATALNNSLPRPLDLTDFRPLTDRAASKIRNQRVIAENLSFASAALGFPIVGVNDARYKTYKLRRQEIKEMEEQYETIKNERSANFGDTEATYRKLLNLYADETLPESATEDFKLRATAELLYQHEQSGVNPSLDGDNALREFKGFVARIFNFRPTSVY